MTDPQGVTVTEEADGIAVRTLGVTVPVSQEALDDLFGASFGFTRDGEAPPMSRRTRIRHWLRSLRFRAVQRAHDWTCTYADCNWED